MVLANSDKEKTEMLSSYFAKSWNTLVPPLCPQHYHYCDMDPSFMDALTCTQEKILLSPEKPLFKSSIYQGCFPASWKLANIVPVPKPTSQKSVPSGYRPVSLLLIVSKIFERHIYMFISDYLSEYHPIACNQWGFQPGR